MLQLTPLEKAGVSHLPPDLVWTGFTADLVVGRDGLLAAVDPIRTAATMLLFTDARCAPEELRFEHAGDRRGYPGDAFDIAAGRGETELGSRLWLYRRHELSDDTARLVAEEAHRALLPLVDQGVASRIEAEAEADKVNGIIFLSVSIIGRDGRQIFATTYDLLWSRA